MNQGEEEEEEEGQVQLSGDLGGRLGGDLAGRPGEDPHQQDPNHRSKTGVEGLSTGCFRMPLRGRPRESLQTTGLRLMPFPLGCDLV